MLGKLLGGLFLTTENRFVFSYLHEFDGGERGIRTLDTRQRIHP